MLERGLKFTQRRSRIAQRRRSPFRLARLGWTSQAAGTNRL